MKTRFTSRLPLNEALALGLAEQCTTIPIPHPIQLTDDGIRYTYLALTFVKGRTLNDCWDQLSLFTKFRIIWSLRGYISQMRRLRRSSPGPVDPSLLCKGPLFTDYGNGPFKTHQELIEWYNGRIEISKHWKWAKQDVTPFKAEGPLVFSHLDLSPTNLMIGEDGLLYIIDWQYAGFYPQWMEYAGMMRYEEDFPWMFRLFVPFMIGTSFQLLSSCLLKSVSAQGFFGNDFKRFCAAGWALTIGARF